MLPVVSFKQRIPARGPHSANDELLPYLVNILNGLIDSANSNITTVDTAASDAQTTADSAATKTSLITITAAVDLDAIDDKVGFITVTGAVDLDTMKTELDAIHSGTPAYTTNNDSTQRTIDADDASGAISATPTQGEVENIRDAVLTQGDVVSTLIEDLKAKGVLG